MALHTRLPNKGFFLTRSHDLTPPTMVLLREFSLEATHSLGREVTDSIVVRALLCYAGHQAPAWRRDLLLPLIEKELSVGTPPQRPMSKKAANRLLPLTPRTSRR